MCGRCFAEFETIEERSLHYESCIQTRADSGDVTRLGRAWTTDECRHGLLHCSICLDEREGVRRFVWVTLGGRKYHRNKDCRGLQQGQEWTWELRTPELDSSGLYDPAPKLIAKARAELQYEPCAICSRPTRQ
jgi:hypothetical protein